MRKLEEQFRLQIEKLEEAVKRQAECRHYDIEDEDVFNAMFEEGMLDQPLTFDGKYDLSQHERKMLCGAVLCLAALRSAKLEPEMLNSLSNGFQMVGFLAMMDIIKPHILCPTCIVKKVSSKNGEIGAKEPLIYSLFHPNPADKSLIYIDAKLAIPNKSAFP